MPLDITEYNSLARDSFGNVIPAGQEPALAVQSLAIAAGSTPSASFSSDTRFVRLHTDAACRVEFRANGPNTDPVATASSQRLPAGATEFFGVRPGYRVAVIQST